MRITHNIPESLRAQKELCKKYAKEHPEDIMSEVMKNGIVSHLKTVCASSASSRFMLLQVWNTQVSTDLPDAMSKASASPRLAKR